MRHLVKSGLLTLFLSCMLGSCSEEQLTENAPLKAKGTANHEICYQCTDELDLIKGRGTTPVLGKVKACIENETDLCLTFESAVGGATINSIKIGIFNSEELVLDQNNNPSPKNFYVVEKEGGASVVKWCKSLQELVNEGVLTPEESNDFGDLKGQSIYLTAEAQFRGGDGLPGGQAWAGTLTENGKYPFDRYFEFPIRECNGTPPPTNNPGCSYSQGFYFSKPINNNGSVAWPSNVTVGGTTVSHTQGLALWDKYKGKDGANCVTAKALFQAATIELSYASGNYDGGGTYAGDAVNTVDSDVELINTLLSSVNLVNGCGDSGLSASNLKKLKDAAGRLGSWIDSHHCS